MLRRMALVLTMLGAASMGSAAVIEDIRVSGNLRIDRSTILYYVGSKVGEEYNEEQLKEDFRRLWSTGFFSDMKLEEKDGEKGKIVTFILKERPVIKAIDYRGNKAVTTSSIQDELKKEKVELTANSVYNPAVTAKAKRIVEKLMKDKGLQFGTVQTEISPTSATEAQLVFKINEGPKARIEEIKFSNNTIISDRSLRRAMKLQKEHWFLSFLTSKDVYSKEKFDEDMDRVRLKYWDKGYLRIQVDPPTIRSEDFKTFLLRRDRKKLFFDIPVREGKPYKTASIKVDGNTVFPADRLLKLVELKIGEPYNITSRNKSLSDIRNLYAERGYFYAQPVPLDMLNDENQTVDLTVRVEENELCYLNRVEFKGNVTTKDKVLRREFMLDEGDVFNSKRFEDSLKRIQQLGLVELTEEPKIEPDPLSKNRLNVTVELKEAQRNQIQFGGGVSQLEGTFGSLAYSTTNFLGAGQNFDVELQGGKRTTNIRLAITEPYFLDKRISLGIDAFKTNTRLVYQGYRQHRTGGSILFGFPLGRSYWRNTWIYGYQEVRFTDIDPQLLEDPFYKLYLRSGSESALTYSIFRNTVDNPLDPFTGNRWVLTQTVSGGWLGGSFDYYRNELELVRYQPMTKKTGFGARFQIQYATGFGGEPLPFRGTIFMGGEQSVRGFPYMDIGPRDEYGNPIGGNKSLLYNLEYYIPIAGPLKAVLFFDAGNVWAEDQGYKPFDLLSSTGLEARFFIPMFRVPFRLIYAYNPTIEGPKGDFKGHDRTAFKFSIGTTF
ncbi:MAG: outer membrane protein assembly factor BamA [Acidobacteriota bacterium]